MPHDRGIAIRESAKLRVGASGRRRGAGLRRWNCSMCGCMPNVTLLRGRPSGQARVHGRTWSRAPTPATSRAGDRQRERRVLELLSSSGARPWASRARGASPGRTDGCGRQSEGRRSSSLAESTPRGELARPQAKLIKTWQGHAQGEESPPMRAARLFPCIIVACSLSQGKISSLFGQSVTALIHDVSDVGERARSRRQGLKRSGEPGA